MFISCSAYKGPNNLSLSQCLFRFQDRAFLPALPNRFLGYHRVVLFSVCWPLGKQKELLLLIKKFRSKTNTVLTFLDPGVSMCV